MGAGPGNPEFLTVKADRLIQSADAVLYDRLILPAVLERAKPGAMMLAAGRAPGRRGIPQDEVNQQMIDLARQGLKVVRLKGGDPMVFGRGGEEVRALMEAGIAVEVVPGISSAWGALTLAGIPATHRGVSAMVTVVSGHDPARLPWDHLAALGGTLVFLMAVSQLTAIVRQLIGHGMGGQVPAAVIEKASWPDQRVLISRLEDLPQLAEEQRVAPPSIIVVGDVVGVLPEARFGRWGQS